jgi:hypothetical protein
MKIFNTLVDLGSIKIKSPLNKNHTTVATNTLTSTSTYSGIFNGLLQPYPDNTLLRAENDRTVYLVADQSKHAFMSQRAFVSRGFEFSNVKVISDFDLDNIPVGDPLY